MQITIRPNMHYRCTIFAKVGEGCLACRPDIVSRGPRPACSVTRRSSGREDDDNCCDEDDFLFHGGVDYSFREDDDDNHCDEDDNLLHHGDYYFLSLIFS